MGLFSSKSKNQYIGVDIGTSNIKLVELNKVKGRINLVTYGSIDITDDVIRSESKEVREKVVASLKQLFRESGVKAKEAIASLPGFSVFTTVLKLPSMTEEELSSAIKWEAKRYIPFPIEQIVLDWEILKGTVKKKKDNNKEEGGKKGELLEIFLTAVPKNVVKRYSEIFALSQVKLIGLEPEAIALVRSLVGNQDKRVMIVDIGATATEICIAGGGFPKLNLSIDTGGNALTKAIAQSLQVNFERAEQFKKDFGVTREKLGGEIPNAIKPVIEEIVEKIRKSMDLFYNRSGARVSEIILSGGSAKLPEFTSYLSSFLEVPISIANPWWQITYPKELEGVLMEMGPSFDVAVGLAMRELSTR
jgi:type IV pilus assembly protein PilM